MKLDNWQKRVLAWSKEKDPVKKNLLICSPRQMGKSTIISEDAGEYAASNQNKVIMIIASVDRQSLLLFEKILSYIYINYKSMIKKGKDKPTKHKLSLTNGSVIHCLPTGDSGFGIRGFTINRLYADEAAFIPEDVWAAVTPMLATTGGSIILLSTPFGIENYFYRMFNNNKFEVIHVNPEEVIENREEPQRTNLIEFRKDEKERMTKLQYQQEHMGLFVGGIQRFIPDELIDSCCILNPTSTTKGLNNNFLGVDVARMGGDETVLVSVRRHGPSNQRQITMFDMEIPEPQTLTDTARLIKHKDANVKYKKIYMDDGGLGVGIFDILHEDRQTRMKIMGLNNAKRSIDILPKQGFLKKGEKPRGKALLGEDMSINLKVLMEKGYIKLLDDPRVKQSLRSMQFENFEGKLRIYGNYSHIFEALKRAAWCSKDKTLNIMPFCY